ncbi:hypothetical protein VTO42DRAFT_1747 [Malbranchea cinnamomea]
MNASKSSSPGKPGGKGGSSPSSSPPSPPSGRRSRSYHLRGRPTRHSGCHQSSPQPPVSTVPSPRHWNMVPRSACGSYSSPHPQNRLRKFWLYLLPAAGVSPRTPLAPVFSSTRSVQGAADDGSRVVPQSHSKLRFVKSSTSVCSPWHEMEHE